TIDGEWVVWARKVARSGIRNRFTPLTGGKPYPLDAVAECRWRRDHDAPQPLCSCGFHAVSGSALFGAISGLPFRPVELDVILSGRVLAFEWFGGNVLFRAARQTVVRIRTPERVRHLAQWSSPDDPDGQVSWRLGDEPKGAGPVRL